MATLVECQIDGPVARITLMRPDKGNSLTPDMSLQLLEALRSVNKPEVQVLVLTGQGKYFCTGMDLGASNQKQMQQGLQAGTYVRAIIRGKGEAASYPRITRSYKS